MIPWRGGNLGRSTSPIPQSRRRSPDVVDDSAHSSTNRLRHLRDHNQRDEKKKREYSEVEM